MKVDLTQTRRNELTFPRPSLRHTPQETLARLQSSRSDGRDARRALLWEPLKTPISKSESPVTNYSTTPIPQQRSALKPDLLAHEAHERKINTLGDPLQVVAEHIDFGGLAGLIDEMFPRGGGSKGGGPPYPSEVMVRVLILKRLYNLSDEQVEYQLLDRMSFRRFCLLGRSAAIPDRNTVWQFQQRIGVDGATALFQGVDMQLERHGYMARGGQAIDATLVAAPIQLSTPVEF